MVRNTNEKNNGCRVVIPAGITLPQGVAGAKLCCLLQKVLTLTCLSNERRHQGHWINVHSTKWRSLLGSRYCRVIDEAVNAGLIEVNEHYSDGTITEPFTKSIRLAKRYRTGRSKIVDVPNQPAIQRLTRSWEPDEKNLGETGLGWFHKLSEFRLNTTALDDPALSDPWTQLVLAKLLDSRIVANRCDYRRLHTLITQLSREARPYLTTIEGEALSIVDVSACQPLILGILAATQPSNPAQPRVSVQLPYVAHFLRKNGDVQKWIQLCERREIYHYLWQAIENFDGSTKSIITTKTGQRVSVDSRGKSESAFKKSSLIPLFDTVESMLANPVFKIIQRDFPKIAEFVLDAKTKSYRVGRRVISHQVLACMAQRFEAETIVDDVGRYLMQHHPDEPVATIHDAVLCRQSFASSVQEIIRSQFERFGVSPTVKIENLERNEK